MARVFPSNCECFEWTLTLVFGFYTIAEFVLERKNYKEDPPQHFPISRATFHMFSCYTQPDSRDPVHLYPMLSLSMPIYVICELHSYHWTLEKYFKPNKTLVTNLDTTMSDGVVKLMLRSEKANRMTHKLIGYRTNWK